MRKMEGDIRSLNDVKKSLDGEKSAWLAERTALKGEVGVDSDKCSPSYGNQSVDLQCKSFYWFLCDWEHFSLTG